MYRFAALTNSPLTRAEIAHQSRSAPRYHRWRRIGVRIILILAFTLAFILAGGEFAGALLYRDPDPISRAFGVANLLPLTVAVAWHFLLMLQTLSLSANSVAREKQANNWDLLILTGVDARQIVRGKWWATVQRQWRKYALLGILRAAVIIWIGSAQGRLSAIYVISYYYLYNQDNPMPKIIVPTPLHFLVAGLIVFALTMVNLLFTAACGVSAISARTRSRALTLGRAIGTRLLIILGIGLVSALLGTLLQLWRSTFLIQLGTNVLITLFDNGVTLGYQLVYWHVQILAADVTYAVLAALLMPGIYLLLTLALLNLAQRLAVRQNALPPKPAKSL